MEYQLPGSPTLGKVGAAAAAVTVELIRRWFRASCLFDPSRLPQRSWDPRDYGFDPASVEERSFSTEDGYRLHGWYCRADRPVASILFCHGKAGNLTSAAESVRSLVEHGFNVLLFDYRGYGQSEGRPSIRGVILDARAASAEHAQIRPPSLPSVIYGYSLGGAVAAQIARQDPFDALILHSTFTNFPDITRHLYPKLPVEWLCGNDFDTDAAISSLALPLLVIHGSDDEIVPCRMGRKLYELSRAPKMLEILEGALHKDPSLVHASRIASVVEHFIKHSAQRGVSWNRPAPLLSSQHQYAPS